MESKIKEIIEYRERNKMLSELQSLAEQEGHIPPMPLLLLRKMEKLLVYSGGCFWGLLLGVCSTTVSLFFFMIFHL